MAASMGNESDRLAEMSHSKAKKMMKRMKKIAANLTEKEKIEISSQPTQVICVQNGGLGNDVSEDELLPLFSAFGLVEGIVMIPQKAFCFVCYQDSSVAVNAVNALNGHLLRKGQFPVQDVILYLLFVTRAPSIALPTDEKPPGLHIVENFVTEEKEQALLQFVDSDPDKDVSSVNSVLKHRRVKHYGYEFKYGINDVDVDEPLEEGIPEICHDFLKAAKEQGLVTHYPDQLTINVYKPGQGIPPHVDTPHAFEDGIMSLSLGSHVVMEFRHPDGQHFSVPVPARSLLIMTGDSRYIWSHGITPKKSDIVQVAGTSRLTLRHRGIRTSFTFRKVVHDAKTKMEKVEKAVLGGKTLPQSEKEALELEKEHVHKVYNDIAEHFSGTRYKPWPRVVDFLMQQPVCSLLADVGCGNGKCLGINKDLFEIGSDFSIQLANICARRGFPTCNADVTCLPFRSGLFDVVLCIAVIHHMATKERRLKAVSEIVRILSPGGKALIYVWAMEQDLNKTQSKYIKANRQKRMEEEEGENVEEEFMQRDEYEVNKDKVTLENSATTCLNVFQSSSSHSENQRPNNHESEVPCEANLHPYAEKEAGRSSESEKNCKELERIPKDVNSLEENAGVTKNKKLHVHVNRTQFKDQDMLVPWQLKTKDKSEENKEKSSQIFHRYYHVFCQGEIEALCQEVQGCAVRKSYYDQGNWCVVLEKL